MKKLTPAQMKQLAKILMAVLAIVTGIEVGDFANGDNSPCADHSTVEAGK